MKGSPQEQQQRRRVVESGGPHAALEAEELARLHEGSRWVPWAAADASRLLEGYRRAPLKAAAAALLEAKFRCLAPSLLEQSSARSEPP